MLTRVIQRKRPRRPAILVVTGAVVMALLSAGVVLALISDSGTHDITRPDSGSSETADLGNATVEYIGSSASNQASGTGLFEPFLRLQGSPTEKGFNTCSQSSCGGDVTQFETKTGSWTKAILASAIPVVDCGGDMTGSLCWELFVDINDGNSSKRISLNEVEVWLTTNARLTGYVDPTGFPSGATQVYDFSGAILINDVNQGSGRGDLRYLIPVQPFAAGDFFVLYSKWGTTAGTAGEFGTGGYASEGGFEEWKVRKAPGVSIVKTADAASVNAGQPIGFTITLTNTGAADATGVIVNDPLPNTAGSGVDWSIASQSPAGSCSITGSPPTETLTCPSLTLAAGGGSLTVHVTSPTTGASCGTYNNTASFTSTNAGTGSSSASTAVTCGAIKILKNSTKGGAVATLGATFSISGPNAPASVSDNGTGDQDSATGVVCVTGLQPGQNYTVNETAAPTGYASAPASEEPQVIVAQAAACGSLTAGATATFTNAPLADLQVRFRDGGSGEAVLDAALDCTNATGTESTTDTTGWDDTLTIEDIAVTSSTITVTCTVVIDP